jgi:glycosyltransferase involved in cell wall biosynthesis
MRILYDSRWVSQNGIGRFASALLAALAFEHEITPVKSKSRPTGIFDPILVGRQFRKGRFDLFVSPGFNGSFLIKRDQVFVVHDLIHIDKRGPFLRRVLNSIYYDRFYRSAASRADAVVTVSKASADQILERWPELSGRLHIIPGGVSSDFTAAEAETARDGLVLFTNDRWHKNLPRVVAGLRTAQFRGTLYLIGKRISKVEKFIQDELPEACIVYVENPSDLELCSIYRSAQALLFCSITEGFGLPIREALSCGCLVVCSAIPPHFEVGGVGCTYVDPLSEASIANGITTVLAAPRIEIETAKQYQNRDWSDVAREFVALIQRIKTIGPIDAEPLSSN